MMNARSMASMAAIAFVAAFTVGHIVSVQMSGDCHDSDVSERLQEGLWWALHRVEDDLTGIGFALSSHMIPCGVLVDFHGTVGSFIDDALEYAWRHPHTFTDMYAVYINMAGHRMIERKRGRGDTTVQEFIVWARGVVNDLYPNEWIIVVASVMEDTSRYRDRFKLFDYRWGAQWDERNFSVPL